jgi:predicted MFS family arabinose efflux permease
MVGVMAMAPMDLKAHGHEHASSYVVSLHIAGMFAVSPLVAWYADRRGAIVAVRVGAVVLVVANLMSVVSPDDVALAFAAMWALGLGWAFALVGGSILLTDGVASRYRVSVQGTADVTMSLAGGLASVAAGVVLDVTGFSLFALLSALFTLLAFAAVFWTGGARR